MSFQHETVLLNEAVEGLNIKPNGIYVDCTLGGAGHSSLIVSHLDATGKLFAFDQDPEAMGFAKEKLSKAYTEGRVTLIESNFRNLKQELRSEGVSEVDGILYDLGVSSPQFDKGERGFSYRFDGPLDMRMNTEQTLTAYDIVNKGAYEDLVRIFFQYGEEKFSKSIARRIEEYRESQPIETTFELVELIKEGIPAATRRTGGHPAKRTFQALRIAVNDELRALEDSLEQAIHLLAPQGRISAISFHSLEDQIVKQTFKKYASGSDIPSDMPLLPEQIQDPPLKLVNRKPILPSNEEIERNRRSKSAKLRIAERTPGTNFKN